MARPSVVSPGFGADLLRTEEEEGTAPVWLGVRDRRTWEVGSRKPGVPEPLRLLSDEQSRRVFTSGGCWLQAGRGQGAAQHPQGTGRPQLRRAARTPARRVRPAPENQAREEKSETARGASGPAGSATSDVFTVVTASRLPLSSPTWTPARPACWDAFLRPPEEVGWVPPATSRAGSRARRRPTDQHAPAPWTCVPGCLGEKCACRHLGAPTALWAGLRRHPHTRCRQLRGLLPTSPVTPHTQDPWPDEAHSRQMSSGALGCPGPPQALPGRVQVRV